MVGSPPPFAPEWTIELVDRPEYRGVIAALFCATSADFATRAVSEMAGPVSDPGVVRVGGLYGPEPPGYLISGRSWIPRCRQGRGRRWRLDLHSGVVEHEIDLDSGSTVSAVRFSSVARPATSVLTVDDAPPELFEPLDSLNPIVLEGLSETAVVSVAEVRSPESLIRVAAAGRGETRASAERVATRRATEALGLGVPAMLRAHRETWHRRWGNAEIEIGGAPLDELAARFALFHLLSLAANPQGELAVGARGLSGSGYGGHIFWDADVFVLPALAAIAPAAATAMLEYRSNRIGAAEKRAVDEGRRGARYPWESAATGAEVTPTTATGLDGTTIAITTGEQEIHISSDIAWAILHHARWTGDRTYLEGPGSEVVTKTARYLAERIELDSSGQGHLRGVTGPDEYHEGVDDNAYTNIMARWHLRQAALLVDDSAEARDWRKLAAALVDGFRADTRRHEQFAGFDALEPALVTAVAEPPVAADLLLGREAVARSQIIKQADVVMLHHLIPDELPPGSLQADLTYYLPRTAHGSSLSPAIHAAVLARAGRPDEALHLLRLALRLDLDDLTGTTAGGVHIATIGGVWQALASGFLGLAVGPTGTLSVDPILPGEWDNLRLRCQVRQRRVEVRASHDEFEFEADRALEIIWPGAPGPVATERIRLVGGHGRWRWEP